MQSILVGIQCDMEREWRGLWRKNPLASYHMGRPKEMDSCPITVVKMGEGESAAGFYINTFSENSIPLPFAVSADTQCLFGGRADYRHILSSLLHGIERDIINGPPVKHIIDLKNLLRTIIDTLDQHSQPIKSTLEFKTETNQTENLTAGNAIVRSESSKSMILKLTLTVDEKETEFVWKAGTSGQFKEDGQWSKLNDYLRKNMDFTKLDYEESEHDHD